LFSITLQPLQPAVLSISSESCRTGLGLIYL
jgi:hypothetical protein